MKHYIPELPDHIISRDCYTVDGERVCYVWALSDRGAEIIGNQYATAEKIMRLKKCGRSTAYRLIASVPKRYWITDARDPNRPRCFSALPLSLVRKHKVQPVGNPNWRSGIYQQGLRARRKKPH